MAQPRPTRLAIATMVAGLVLVAAAGVWRASSANWDVPLFCILLGFSVFSDLTAISTTSKVKISGSFLALVLAMVFLGGTPAAVIGVLTIFAGWLRWRDEGHYLLNNVLTYATFPLVSGIAFHEIVDNGRVAETDASFYALIFGIFLVALAINFTMIASYSCYLDRSSFFVKVRTALFPLLPSELAAALMAVGVAYLYVQLGLAGVAMFGVVLVTFQYLLGALLVSQQRAEELELRSKQRAERRERRWKQLASFQVGLLSAMLRTPARRAQMTARHSAAVARYSRAI